MHKDYYLLSPYKLDRLTVKKLQLDLDITNAAIARQTGITPVDISRHINGRGRNPKIQQAIACALSIPLADIQQRATTAAHAA